MVGTVLATSATLAATLAHVILLWSVAILHRRTQRPILPGQASKRKVSTRSDMMRTRKVEGADAGGQDR